MSRPVAIVIAVAALAGACGKKIDTGDAEAKIKAWATDDVGAVKAVSCPDAEMKKGATFVCKVTFDTAGPFDLNVEQKDDSGTVVWTWPKPLGGGPTFEAMVVRVIKDKTGNDVTAKCPAGIQVLPDDGLPCTIDFAGQDAVMLVKKDADGNVDIEPKK